MTKWHDKPVLVLAAARVRSECSQISSRPIKRRKANEVIAAAEEVVADHYEATGHDDCCSVEAIGFVATCKYCKNRVPQDPSAPLEPGYDPGGWRTFREAVEAARIHEATSWHQVSAQSAVSKIEDREQMVGLVEDALKVDP